MPRRKGIRASTLAAFGSWLLACHSGPPPKSPAALPRRVFLLQSRQGAELLAGTRVRLSFSDDTLSMTASCNHMSGRFELDAGRLVMSDMMQTEMGCDEARHAQDEWLQKFLGARPTLTLEGRTLTLASDTARLVFLDREVADPDRPLVGTVWELNQYIDGDSAMGLMGIESPRLTFAADGSWQARSKCLDTSGRYTLDGERVVLSETRASEISCTGNDAEAAAFVRSVLVDGTFTYETEARSLTLSSTGKRHLAGNAAEAPSH